MEKILEVKDLRKEFHLGYKKDLVAVNGVSFDIYEKETFGLIGESGSGKSTVGRCLLHLIPPTAGSMLYKGMEYSKFSKQEKQVIRRSMQMVFQDPYYSLNPRKTIYDTVSDTLKVNKALSKEQREEMTIHALGLVHIKTEDYNKYAHQISAGQQQRVGIARAIAANPKFVVLDEPTSSLDMSIRAEIIDLLRKLQQDVGMSYMFISHDLSTIRYLCHRVAVMYLGTIVEYGTAEQLFLRCAHPYSKALLAAVMIPDPRVKRKTYKLTGEIPSAINLPKACPLASRCAEACDKCFKEEAPMVEVEDEHFVKCHFAKPLSKEPQK